MCSRRIQWTAVAILTFLLAASGFAQSKLEKRTLVLNGHTGEITVFMVDGQPFINARALVDIGHGNVAFNGNTIVLNFDSATSCAAPAESAAPTPAPALTPAPVPAAPEPPSNALSTGFMNAAVQELAILKDWRGYMAYGITKGVPGDGSRLVLNQNKATEALQLAETAVSTDADRSAYPLLKANFDYVNNWYATLVQGRKNMTTGNYSMSEDPLKNDSQYQKIVACSNFLSTMIPSGTFSDDGSCP
jgi:hypothetical protein